MAKKLAVILGIVIVLVGLLGFVSNPIVGANGYFLTDHYLDVIYILIGIILLIGAGKGESAAATSLKVFGIVYLLLFLDGLYQPTNLLGLITANNADTWLHLVLGIVLIIAGFLKGSSAIDSSMV